MQKILSIVVPVYNVERYISKCLDSCIVDEHLRNRLEVIIVNDGTPDRSAEMSREYVKRYPDCFRQIDKENGGHGSAWNVGLKEATGKYIRFLDSDDWLSNLDRLITDLDNCDSDVVLTRFNKCYGVAGKAETSDLARPGNDGGPGRIDASKWGQPSQDYNFWSATYKTSVLKPLHPLFAEFVMYDDYILTWAPLVYGRTYSSFDYVVYNYLNDRPGQSMSVSSNRKRAASYWICFRQYETVRKRVEDNKVPEDLLCVIDESVTGYARLIFWYMVFLPYKESKSKLTYLSDNYLKNDNSFAVLRRYCKLPFLLFYCLENIRLWLKSWSA